MKKLKYFFSIFTLCLVVGMLGACSQLTAAKGFYDAAVEKGGEMTDAALDKAAAGFDQYCLKVPKDKRANLRLKLNERTEEGDVFVYCRGDQDAGGS